MGRVKYLNLILEIRVVSNAYRISFDKISEKNHSVKSIQEVDKLSLIRQIHICSKSVSLVQYLF